MFEIILLTLLTWLAYWDILKCGFVSDDIEGLANYDGKLKKFDYGHLNKWILYKLYGKSPIRNHAFSILLHNANVILLFAFLSTFLPYKLAFYISILFAVHPICIQSIAWISGRGYPLSLFFTLLGFNWVASIAVMPQLGALQPLSSISWALLVVGYGLIYYLAVNAQFAVLATFIIQALFHNYFLSIIGACISGVMLGAIIKEVINIRVKTFKEQNLGASTTFKLSKIIVAFKSLAYYTRLCLFPKRLGLYHTYEYHYSEKTEQEDKWFWWGFVLLLGLMAGFWFGNNIIRFGILWYLAYIFIFLNWITIHQFVSERYVYIPIIGICVLVAYGISILDGVFFNHYPVIFALIAGIALMRTWTHLPSYQDEVQFYQSNIWNFPDSEVAFANLGVVYTRCNLIGSAMDMWMISTKINPDYDVGYYNIHSLLKQRGDLVKAKEFLEKAVNSKQCHFKELWVKELEQLNHEISYVNERNLLLQQISELSKDLANKEQVEKISQQLLAIDNIHTKFEESKNHDLVLVQQEEKHLREKLFQIEKSKENLARPVNIEDLVKMRDLNFVMVKETVNRMLIKTNEKTPS